MPITPFRNMCVELRDLMKNKVKWVSAEPEHGKLGEVLRMWHIRNKPRTRSCLFSCISWVWIKMLALYCFTIFFSHFYTGLSLINLWGEELHWHYVSNKTMSRHNMFYKVRRNLGIKIIEHFLALSKFVPAITWY